MKKNNDIEVLRAIGILYVIISHLPTFTPWAPSWHTVIFNHTYFWSGVDLFFAVSGFVIMKSISPWISKDKNEKYLSDTVSFWVKRFYRLIPASWFFLLLTFIASIVFNKYGTLGVPNNNFIDALTQFFICRIGECIIAILAKLHVDLTPIIGHSHLKNSFIFCYQLLSFY